MPDKKKVKEDKNKVVVGTLEGLGEPEYLPTGVEELDTMIGGWSKGRLTELWGNPGTGKSYLLSKTMASLKDGQKCLYVDAEFALYKPRLVALGVDVSKVDVVQDGRLEEVTEHILEVMDNYDLVIIDSLAKLVPMTVEDNKVGENALGLFARQVKHFEAKLKPRLANSKTAFVVINQARAGFGMMSPAKPMGGFAWEHAIDIRLKISKGANNAIKKQKDGVISQTGHWVDVKVEKSRLTPPFLATRFKVEY